MQPAVIRLDERRERAPAPAEGPRFDVYAFVHKGIRTFMGATLDAVGRVDPLDPQEVATTLQGLRSLTGFLRAHLHHENQFIHPALEARRPGSACRSAGEHVEHERALEALEGDALALERASDESRADAARRLYRNLALLVAENLEHMHAEETDNNAALWAAYTDAELARVQQALIAAIPADEMSLGLRWMLPAMAPAERAALFAALPRTAHGEILESLRPHLGARDWAKLTAAIGPLDSFH
ncbi:MAG: hemerythrin domain-containing protein [Betaproteobacteria bacterium]|nr:hemerythrin domain-containing protein [Betaproteobacteria bacterium]